MATRDARKLDHKTLEEIRIRAVERVRTGESPAVVVAALGFSRACIYNWLARYRAGGCAALKARPLTGCPPKINGSQLRWLYRTIVGKNPVTRIGLQPRLMNVVKFSPSVDRPAFVGAGDDEDVNVRLDGENSPSIKQSSSRATRRRG